jgi:hypothetical protein
VPRKQRKRIVGKQEDIERRALERELNELRREIRAMQRAREAKQQACDEREHPNADTDQSPDGQPDGWTP